MNVEFDDSVKQWGEGYTLAQQATKRLESVLGPSASTVEAMWTRTEDDRGRVVLTLQLGDHTGYVAGKFAPDELRSAAQTSFRMHRLWGDLLQTRNERHLAELTGTGE